jgi:hypothetical protein
LIIHALLALFSLFDVLSPLKQGGEDDGVKGGYRCSVLKRPSRCTDRSSPL